MSAVQVAKAGWADMSMISKELILNEVNPTHQSGDQCALRDLDGSRSLEIVS